MKGKEKCKILKEIRAEIARANDIEWVTENCTHKGDCRGTCPKCESEVRALERALARRKALGKTVAVVGLSAGIIATSTSCEALEEYMGPSVAGDMIAPEFTTTNEIGGLLTLPPTTGDIAVDGGMEVAYFTTDYTLLGDPIPYRATDTIILFSFDDVEYDENVIFSMSAGAEFTVVGKSTLSDNSVMVKFNDLLFRVEGGYEVYCQEWLPTPEA